MKTTYQENFVQSKLDAPVYYHSAIKKEPVESKKRMITGYMDYINTRKAKEERYHTKMVLDATYSNLHTDLTLDKDSANIERKHVMVNHKPEKFIQANPQKRHDYPKSPSNEEKYIPNKKCKIDKAPSPMYKSMNDKIDNIFHRDTNTRQYFN